MAKIVASALALVALPTALGFSNTSPFFLFSTADLLFPDAAASVADSSQITTDVLAALKDCPTRSYILIEQGSVSSADYVDGHSTPRLSHYMGGKHEDVRTTVAVPEVVGRVDSAAVASHLKSHCGHKSGINIMDAPGPISKAARMQGLQNADDVLGDLIVKDAQSEDYTVIYITSPVDNHVAEALLEDESQPYEMERPFGEFEQLELKRDLSSHVRRANSTNTAGLFERYQYFTPGIFMAFGAVVPLSLILLVGIRALLSLEVSYFAFSKEMGPNAQKKQ